MAPIVGSGESKDKSKNKNKPKPMDKVSAKGKVDLKPTIPDGDRENKQWFEDRKAGDGSPINSFPLTTRKSLANESNTSANKSWYEIVEEDENAEKAPREENVNASEANIVMGVKIKQEKIDKYERSTEKDAKDVPLIAKIKVEKDSNIIIKKEKDDVQAKTPKTERVPTVVPKKQEKSENPGLKRERDVKSSLSSESDSDLKEKRVKQQKHERRSPRAGAKKPKAPERYPSKEPNLIKEPTPVKQPAWSKKRPTLSKEPNKDKSKETSKESNEEEPVLTAEDIKLARLTSMRKRNRDQSKEGTRNKRERNHSTSTDNSSGSQKRKIEKDPATLARRQKQIDFGKNTVGYDRYLAQVPKEKRNNLHPRTPPKHQHYSRRAWDGMVKIWRQQLHIWDPPGTDAPESMSEISTTNSSSHFSDDYTSTTDSYEDAPDDCLHLGIE